METRVDEIAARVYRMSTFVASGAGSPGFTFNQFLVDADEPLLIRRSYFDHSPIDYEWNGISFTDYHHTISDLYMGLYRAGYRVDMMLEPEPNPDGPRSQFWRDAFRFVPRTLIVRARKEGS